MVIHVIADLRYFLVLFFIFVLTFAECYHILNVDIEPYGERMEHEFPLGSHMIATLRSAMGDFALIDMFEGFDRYETQTITINGEEKSGRIYRHSFAIVGFTFVVFIFGTLALFVIFMNFIIALISDSFGQVNQYSIAYDYKLRVDMIHERENHFREKDFETERFFPNILIVRKRKENSQKPNNIQSHVLSLREFVKDQSLKCMNVVSLKARE